jgi:hypothetical protein
MPNSPKWTVLFIVHAVDDQSRYYSEQLFTELLQVEPSEDLRILVLRNTYDYQDNTDTHAYLWEVATKNSKRIKKRVLPEEIGYPSKEGKEKSFGKLNFGSSETLRNIFYSIKNHYEIDNNENKVLLFTWDHGYAFGIFDPNEYDKKEALPIKSAPTTDMLMVKELAKAIETSFTKIPILIMMNCWMQSIETNCQLRECVDYLIAPETSIDWLGYDYISILNQLIKNPNINEEQLAKDVIKYSVKRYLKWKEDKGANVAIDVEELILSATRPALSEKVTDKITDLVIALESALPGNIKKIANARKITIELTKPYGGGGRSWCFVDILNLAYNFKNQALIDKELVDSFRDILNPKYEIDIIDNKENETETESYSKSNSGEDTHIQSNQKSSDNFILCRYTGNEFKKNGKEHGGLSICFPNNRGFIERKFYKDFYSFENGKMDEKIAFSRDTPLWPKFIKEAIETGGIKLEKEDTNYRLNINSNVHIDQNKVTLDHILVTCEEEKDDGLLKPFSFPATNFLLNLKMYLNTNKDNLRIDSLIVQCSSFDGSNDLIISTVNRGAGGNKTGAGSGNKTGAGGNKTGAGGNKTGAGGGQLIVNPALENLGTII